MSSPRWIAGGSLASCMDEDVTVLGEQVAELHLDTLADDLDPTASDHYRRALENYDQAKQLLATSETVEDVIAIEQVVADARYHRAAVLAVIAGDPLPERREPCFFNPQHGPAPCRTSSGPRPAARPRSIPVCAADARALAAGDEPLVRMVRVGDRLGAVAPGRRDRRGAIDAGVQLARGSSTASTASRTWRRPTSSRRPTGSTGSVAPTARAPGPEPRASCAASRCAPHMPAPSLPATSRSSGWCASATAGCPGTRRAASAVPSTPGPRCHEPATAATSSEDWPRRT